MTALPNELLLALAERGAAAWWALVRAAPAVGRYSLRPEVQERMKERFASHCKDPDADYWVLPSGTLHGPYVSWHKGGAKRVQCAYRNGELDGLYLAWREDGSLAKKIEYRCGVRRGVYIRMGESGGAGTGTYENGVLVSYYTERDAEGKVRKRFSPDARGEAVAAALDAVTTPFWKFGRWARNLSALNGLLGG